MANQDREIRRYNKYISGLMGTGAFGLYNVKNKEQAAANYVMDMLNRTQAMYRYEGLPEGMTRRKLEIMEQCNGYIGIIEHEGKIYAVTGGLGGEPDAYYMPTQFIVANPALKLSKTYTIHEDCVIIPNDPLYIGLLPLMRKYATAMTEADLSIYWATVNSRINTVFAASDETTQLTAKQFLKDIQDGEIGIITDPAFSTDVDGVKGVTFNASSAVNGTMISLMELKQYLKGTFYMDIGIKSPFNMKREALGDSENNLQDASLLPLVDAMTECRKDGWEEANEMFGLNVRVDLSSAWEDVQAEPEHNIEELTPEKEQEGNEET